MRRVLFFGFKNRQVSNSISYIRFFMFMEKISIQDFIEKLEDAFENMEDVDLKPETNFRDLENWTSLNAMIIVAMFESELDTSITFSQLRECETVSDLYNLI